MRDLSDWVVADIQRDTITLWKCVSRDTGQRLVFVVEGCEYKADYDEDGYCGHYPNFDSFTIDGRESTDEEQDEHSDDIRALIRDIWSQT